MKGKTIKTNAKFVISLTDDDTANNAQMFSSISEDMSKRIVKAKKGAFYDYEADNFTLGTAKESLLSAIKKIDPTFEDGVVVSSLTFSSKMTF